jgi:hypothetical protein
MTGSPAAYVAVAIAGGLAQTIVSPIFATLMTVLYFDYTAERLSGDLPALER